MSAVLNFDASQVQPDSGVQDPVPAGWYNTVIDQSELKPTKDATGHYLEIRHNIIDGAHAGKKIYGRLNLRNANPTAQEIGYKQLSAVCHAVGVLQVQDSAQLHNIPLKIKVKLRAASGDYEASNEIVSWKNINEVVQMASAVSAGFPAPAGGAPTPPAFSAPMQPPAAPAPQAPQFAPPQQQAPQQAPAAPQWQAPAAPQPWAQPQAPQMQPQSPVQQPQMQQQAAPQFAPPPMQPQAPAPAPQPAPVQQAPAQQPAQQPAAPQAPVQQPWQGAQTATPPWMAPQAPQA